MKKKKYLVLLSVLLLIGIFLLGFNITSVRVTGNRMYTAEQLEALIFPGRLSRNSAVCFVEQLLGKKKSIPFVQDYKVSFTGPASVEIIVYEKSIVGYVTYMSSRLYFDKDGIIVESSGKQIQGIPEITGLRFGQIVLYQKLPVENDRIFSMILNLTQALSSYGIPADRIRYDRDLRASLTVGEITVLLGADEEMNGKLSELSNILPQIQELSGTLDLSDYDPADANRMYSFKKR
ncbi:MAG: cell division protein FtsQ/DivIB [Stomatobaculum sp.]